MDEGIVTSSNGKKADCRNSIVILTSNLGAAENEKNTIGFNVALQKTGEDDKAVQEFFKPEFRNRLDGIVKFNKLEEQHIKLIVNKFINEINDLLSDKNIKIYLTDEALDHIVQQGYDKKLGARPLYRKIDELIKIPLSKKILFENITNCTVDIDYRNELTFDIVASKFMYDKPNMVDKNGYIVVGKINANC
jgi:ATP-dependent Clp protease ATP-binding subunit ClpA